MKEIKFRIWAKGAKKMHYDNFNITPDGKVGQTWGIYEHNLEIMQFTGLKDKNGKEIYEGDILLMTYGKGAKNLGVVEFKMDYAQFILSHPANGFACMCREIEARQDEVIGNIYENPELLSIAEGETKR